MKWRPGQARIRPFLPSQGRCGSIAYWLSASDEGVVKGRVDDGRRPLALDAVRRSGHPIHDQESSCLNRVFALKQAAYVVIRRATTAPSDLRARSAAPPLAVRARVFPRHQAEIGLHLVRTIETTHLVDRRRKPDRIERPDPRHCHQPPALLVLRR
jgi:hypothetical protein